MCAQYERAPLCNEFIIFTVINIQSINSPDTS